MPVPPLKTGITTIETLMPTLLSATPGQAPPYGPFASGLGYGGVFLVWQAGPWRDPLSCTDCGIPVYFAGLEGGESGTWLCYDLSVVGWKRETDPEGGGVSLRDQ